MTILIIIILSLANPTPRHLMTFLILPSLHFRSIPPSLPNLTNPIRTLIIPQRTPLLQRNFIIRMEITKKMTFLIIIPVITLVITPSSLSLRLPFISS